MNNNIMGCTSSVYAIGKRRKKKQNIPEVSVCVPSVRIPALSDVLQAALRGLIPQDLVHRITSLRNRIALVAEDTGGTAITELTQALEDYLPLVIGLVEKVSGLQGLVEFRWKEIEKGKQETDVANSWFELLSVLHMLGTLTLMDANLKLIPSPIHSTHSDRLVSADCMRDAVDLLLKAAGYLNFCVHHIIPRLPPDIVDRLPSDLQKGVLEAISHQALAQGTEIQLGLAVKSHNATLSVKRRLACEQLSYFAQAHCCLSEVENEMSSIGAAAVKKQSLFLKWKHLEAKGAAYYYHGLVLDKGDDPASHEIALLCFLAAEELLADGKKACLTFCLSDPITRAPPAWGAMKHLHKKIPETASKKSQMYGYLLDQVEKDVQILPDLPEFQLSLQADEFELPEVDPAWDCGEWEIPARQMLKQHLNDGDDQLVSGN